MYIKPISKPGSSFISDHSWPVMKWSFTTHYTHCEIVVLSLFDMKRRPPNVCNECVSWDGCNAGSVSGGGGKMSTRLILNPAPLALKCTALTGLVSGATITMVLSIWSIEIRHAFWKSSADEPTPGVVISYDTHCLLVCPSVCLGGWRLDLINKINLEYTFVYAEEPTFLKVVITWKK